LTLDTLLPVLLVAQGVIGGLDTLLNHELIEKLPQRIQARTEIGVHAIREALYASLFGGSALFAWHGMWAAMICVLLVATVAVDACDEFIENRTRVLPQNERILHFFLTLNLGMMIAVSVPPLFSRTPDASALVPVDHGMLSWILSALGLGAAAWSIRDFLAWRALGRAKLRDGIARSGYGGA
jgi:hypothetical protein